MRFALPLVALTVAAAPLAAQDYHFTHQIAAGGDLRIDNINGAVDVVPAAGRVAEVTVVKTVKRGDGNMVKAIMEETGNGIRVCTIYVNRDPSRHTCSGDNNNDSRHGDNFEVEMHYTVHVPAGARLQVDDVNGGVSVRDVDTDANINTVNGSIDFTGTTASRLETVNGHINAALSRAAWSGTLSMSTVNGGIDITLPAGANTAIHGTTVNGGLSSPDFPITISKGWGPKSLDGQIGSGGRQLNVETVNGGITLHKH
ncbi:MAG TPA: DUF4097 family beta strand repeat-containing protein [Gemmatimonadales bacterium]